MRAQEMRAEETPGGVLGAGSRGPVEKGARWEACGLAPFPTEGRKAVVPLTQEVGWVSLRASGGWLNEI